MGNLPRQVGESQVTVLLRLEFHSALASLSVETERYREMACIKEEDDTTLHLSRHSPDFLDVEGKHEARVDEEGLDVGLTDSLGQPVHEHRVLLLMSLGFAAGARAVHQCGSVGGAEERPGRQEGHLSVTH